jgi:hypothetical protein
MRIPAVFFPLCRVRLAFHDGHRRSGPEIARMNNSGKRLAYLGKIVVDPAMDPRGKKREALQKTAHVRIVAAVRIQQEPPGYLGILARKLAAHLVQIGQFALIVFQHLLAHDLLYLVLAADQFQYRVEFDLFVHVFVSDLPFDMKPQASAEHIRASQEDARLGDPRLKRCECISPVQRSADFVPCRRSHRSCECPAGRNSNRGGGRGK